MRTHPATRGSPGTGGRGDGCPGGLKSPGPVDTGADPSGFAGSGVEGVGPSSTLMSSHIAAPASAKPAPVATAAVQPNLSAMSGTVSATTFNLK